MQSAYFFLLMIIAASGAVIPAHAEPLDLSRELILAMPPLTEPVRAAHLPTLRKGSRGKAIGELRELLVKAGLEDFGPVQEDVFDDEYDAAVKMLQERFGLKPDGIAGPVLYANIETGLADKNAAVEAFALRLEQLAHVARSEGRRKMIVVNVPSFTLRAIDLTTGRTVVESPVVIGRRDRQTPLGRLNIISLKYNPTWTPPPLVLERDIVPRLDGGDRKWFDSHRLVATGPDGEVKEAHEVTREEYEAGWKFQQKPGPGNALGRLKFETDSKDNIYLHDTNEHRLFSKVNRTHSSGCVRVQKWAQLAAFLAETSEEKILDNVEKKGTEWQRIERVPVFVEYWRGDVSDKRAVYFPDIYARSDSAKVGGPSPVPGAVASAASRP
jgi:L,D-transpeptidase YcbB